MPTHIDPLDFDDPEAQEPEPVPVGVELQLELRGATVVSTSNGLMVKVFSTILTDEYAYDRIDPVLLNPIDNSREELWRRRDKAAAKKFCEGWGIDNKSYNSVMANAVELHENEEDTAEAFEPWLGKTAHVVTMVNKSKNPEYPDSTKIGRYLENRLAAKSSTKKVKKAA